jgi:hypothetical protein
MDIDMFRPRIEMNPVDLYDMLLVDHQHLMFAQTNTHFFQSILSHHIPSNTIVSIIIACLEPCAVCDDKSISMLCDLCQLLVSLFTSINRNRTYKDTRPNNAGMQGSLTPKSYAIMIRAIIKHSGNGAPKQLSFLDLGHGDGRLVIYALRSGLFGHVFGVEIGDDQQDGCKNMIKQWALKLQLDLNKMTLGYGLNIETFFDDTLIRSHNPQALTIFSFMQGWSQKDVSQFVQWVNEHKPTVICITGHSNGPSAIASDKRVQQWLSELKNYSLIQSLNLHMAVSSSSVIGRFFAYNK